VLFVDEENWGPRPAGLLKCWSDIPGYRQLVSIKWKSFQIDGWGGYVVKQKFKLIKLALKEWHVTHSQNLPRKIEAMKDRMAVLDGKGESELLTDVECAELHGLATDIYSLSRLNTSICWQQSRVQWLRDGDANSKFFHSLMSYRRRHNALCSIVVDGVVVEGVQPIRNAVFTHFAKHFQSTNVERPSVDNLNFQSLSVSEGVGVASFFGDQDYLISF